MGFVVVKAANLDYVMGVTLLIITASPGGAYSNWFCSIFNADLALSVTMTAFSTILSVALLPLNVLIYVRAAYGGDVVDALDWTSLGISLVVVVAAITSGIFISAKYGTPQVRNIANKVGNISGLGLILFTSFASEGGRIKLGGREAVFYWATVLPILLGLLSSMIIATLIGLKKPERMTVSIECAYQNTGIAMTACLALFKGEEQQEAIGVPFWYTGMETLFVGCYCLIAWKLGWSKAPANENIIKVILRSYEVAEAEEDDGKENYDLELEVGGGDHEKEEESDEKKDGTAPSPQIRPFQNVDDL